MWAAKAKPNPVSAASRALKSLDPSSHNGGSLRIDRYRPDRAKGVIGGEGLVVEGQQLGEQLGVVVGSHRLGGATHGECGDGVGAGGASQSQVDPSRVKRFQQPERLGDLQRSVVRQHHAAGSHPQRGMSGWQRARS